MHPAFSVIFLTTLIGAGQGLFLALYTAQVYSQFHLLPMHSAERFYVTGSGVSLLLLIAGLLASFFHLGHPERAWRAAARWRTSWLSREVVVLPAVILLVALYGLFHYAGWTTPLIELPGGMPLDLTLIVGFVATLATFALFVATGMIYASIKFLLEWHSPLTVVNYTLLGTASGFTLATLLSVTHHAGLDAFYASWATILTLLAMASRLASMFRNRRLRYRSTPATAIGVRHTRIVQKAQGAMGGSFNTREYFHGRSAAFVRNIRLTFPILAFVVPVLLMIATAFQPVLMLPALAVAIQFPGLVLERWHFFADARHPQNIYYQQIA